ncbi:hypothetical protein F4780DRAFT_204069 [Xylariomycetidae sp. FL0641]|nr:hypothetical protein F4780DRAFT_204069 [Xylariomycetidae sp. FL0641]
MQPSSKAMLSSVLRPKPGSRRADPRALNSHSNTPSPGLEGRDYLEQRHATADFTEADDDEDEDEFDLDRASPARVPRISFEDHGRETSASLIPLFSAGYLGESLGSWLFCTPPTTTNELPDSLPVYHVVHAIRIIVQTRTETSLSWEQLKSPQVSQFLVKPMQQQIRTQHFSRVTLYALVANCLQFAKEAQLYPGNAGTSNTRAKVCELLALKLLKEYSTRELIDALSYDFNPLQGAPEPPSLPSSRLADARNRPAAARSSTLEVAIRASAKHFLAHPLVVQQMEAIWNGAISFYSSHDSLHRTSSAGTNYRARSNPSGAPDMRTPLLNRQPDKELPWQLPFHAIPVRRTVALYDPRHASPFKLSRLRVPRYRQFLSTCSLFVLICLFLAVLVEHSSRITSLELFFWFWSAGFMLDEVVGFNEQGFSLYMMSFWNIFDLGILLLLIIYYCMRIYGVFLVDPYQWNEMAYDVLAANAILLLPRIWNVLDHYKYFSQLLIAFRLMAVDLVAVLVLVLISCSGFFVFFTLSKNHNDAGDVAYKIFQILMGFSPAAWDVWPEYNFLGRLLLVFFLIICHFLVVTILITVLTNSFMAIASNAEEEHQFLFAINTISMVKNDSLFSYIAPANIFAWMLMPLRYVMSIRNFVLLNRTVIKATHWPILFTIFVYEKYVLASTIYEPTDLVDHQGQGRTRHISFADPASRGAAMFSPNVRTREESVVGMQKDRTLDEVFRRPPDPSTLRTQRKHERRKTQTAIRNWMDQNEEIGERLSHWPTIDSRPSLTHRQMSMSRDIPRRFRNISDVRSAASDPADLMSNSGFPTANMRELNGQIVEQQARYKDQADADGDDELVTNDEDEDDDIAGESHHDSKSQTGQEDYFTSMPSRQDVAAPSSFSSSTHRQQPTTSPRPGGAARRQGLHARTMSTNTILFNPQDADRNRPSSPSVSAEPMGARTRPRTSRLAQVEQSGASGTRSPRRPQHVATPSRPKPIPMKSAPNRAALLAAESRRDPRRRLSSVDLGSDHMMLTDGGNNEFGAVPASFATQMAMATGQLRKRAGSTSAAERENADRMSRLVLARMKTLEESFAEVVREMRVLRSSAAPSTTHTAQNSADDISGSLAGDSPELVPHRRLSTAGRRHKKQRSRPGSAREDKVDMTGNGLSPRNPKRKGKGKQVVRSDDSDSESESQAEAEVEARRQKRRGSSS